MDPADFASLLEREPLAEEPTCPPGHSCIRCYPPKPWQQERLGSAVKPTKTALDSARDRIMGVLEVYAKDDPYCWAILKSSRQAGRLTPELVAELIRHQCERAKNQTMQIDKLARMQPPAPIQIDGAAATMLDLAKKTSDSQALRIKSLEDVLVAIRAKLTRKMQREVELWNAVNEYAASCGGNPGAGGPVTGRRMDAVVAVNRAVRMDPDDVIAMIGETLDPCKPWCVLARDGIRHEGACLADEVDDGE